MVKIKSTKHRNCVDCCINLTKLKRLCHQKGLQTSFTHQFKTCAKDKVIIINNSCKCKMLSTKLKKALVSALISACKQIFASKRKTRQLNKQIKLDAFLVEDECLNVSDATLQYDPSIILDGNDIEESNALQAVNNIMEHSNNSSIFIKPEVPQNIINCASQHEQDIVNTCVPPNEQDSLGLLNCTENNNMKQSFDNIRAWTKYGFPYIGDLPESQYDIPMEEKQKAAYGWTSPQLSPILP